MNLKQTAAVLLLASITFFSCSKSNSAGGGATLNPVADFTYSGTGLAPATVSFSNTSTSATSYLWDFGDNSTATTTNPSHVYTQGGVYTVTLTAYGNGTNNTTTRTVNITTPTSVKILSAKVTNMPFLDPSCGCGWDPNSGPDVYFELTDNSSNVLVTGGTIPNVTQGMLPLSWSLTTPYQITNFTPTYKVWVYDQDINDIPPSADDLIGGYSFSFSSYTSQGYPTTITLQNPSVSTLVIQLTVQWQ